MEVVTSRTIRADPFAPRKLLDHFDVPPMCRGERGGITQWCGWKSQSERDSPPRCKRDRTCGNGFFGEWICLRRRSARLHGGARDLGAAPNFRRVALFEPFGAQP